MNEELRQRIETYESLFSQPGWKLLMTEIEDWKAAIAKQWRTLRPDQLQFEQGRYDGLDQIAGFENLVAGLKADAETIAASLEDV